jgi:putative effector of murein hydrolase
MGRGAHAIGTSRAFEFGQLEGTFSSLSMIVAAAFTVLLAPLLILVLT